MPANSNIVKTITNPNRFGPQPGGGLMNRSGMTAVVNPAQQANRPGPINSAYPPTSMPQRTAGGNSLLSRANGRIGSNVPSWNFTPGSSLASQTISARHQNFTSSYPNAIHSVHPQQNDTLDMSEFPALGSANTTSNNSSATGMGSSYANTAQTGTNATSNDNRSMHHQQPTQEFTIDDFPALPGATSNSGNRGIVGSQLGVSQHHLVNHHQQNSMDGLNNGNSMSTDISSSGVQDGRISNGGIRPPSQPQVNSVSEQDKKNFSTKSGGSVQIMQQIPSSSLMMPYSLTGPANQTTPYSTTSTLTGTPYPPSIGIPNLQSTLGGAPSLNQSSSSPSSVASDEFGLLGLLSVIRMTDPDLSMLALGSDLTTLGLNLNSPDVLYATFTSPWSENNQIAGLIEPEYHLPSCYNVQPPPPAQSKIGSFSEETLFYIFYSMPRDILQETAAQELYNRNWRYHKEYRFWLTKELGTEPIAKTQNYERGNYIYFDPNSWEKVKKEFVLMYDMLEERPMMGNMSSMSGSSAAANLSSLAPSGLQQQQQAVAQQNLAANSMNMASLMGLDNIPSRAGSAGVNSLAAGALAGLGATPAQLQQLHHQYPTGANAGPHHPLGPVSGLGQGGHYISQGALKDY
ncbi:2819_t:CDS:2 [Funneliformis mosseae]|uniref:2819_t:CDS:1 n=1 Tax=Funneliformis mosseae TaxID=27381 RepID=A0A9N9BT05_FUNMO|nr:2819_t:CDS:2 [Funneliformis mosseae]